MGYTKNYLKAAEKLSLRGKIPVSQVARAYNASIKEPDKRAVLRRHLIENYTGMVNNIAKRISMETHLELDELIQQGNLHICEFFSKDRLPEYFVHKLNFQVNQGLRKYALEQIIENLRKERLSPEFIDPKEHFKGEFSVERIIQEIDEKAKRFLTSGEYAVFRNLHPMYETPKTLGQIGQEIQRTRTTVLNRYTSACRKMEKAISKFIEEEPHRMRVWPLEGTKYSPELVKRLDQKLKAKQGIGLAELSAALDFSPASLASFIARACNIYIRRQQKEELFKEYGGELERRVQISREEMRKRQENLHSQITSYLGITPREFIAYFNMSQEDFIRFISEKFPGMSDKEIKRVISLNKKEKEGMDFPIVNTELNELELLERVLHLLEEDRYNKYFPNLFSRVTERLKHALFPVYINDPNKCLGMLEEKVEEYQGNTAENYFREVYNFFSRGPTMQPERLKTRLDNFQGIDVLTLVDRGRHILASETGVGKSLEIIAAAEALGVEKALILTNKTSTIATWEKEIEKHLGDKTVVITGDSRDKEGLFSDAKGSKWVVCNYETYYRYLARFQELGSDMVVIDEADVMNNPSSNRTKAILETNAKYKFCVSGWVYRNRRKELWPILNWLYPEEYPFQEQFARDYCQDEWGRLRLKYELTHKLIYRPKSLVLPDLPALSLETIKVSMTPEEKQEYQTAEADFIGWYQEHASGTPNGIAISKLHSLRKLALKPKFQVLYKRLRKRHQAPNKTVVFCSYLDEAGQIANEMNKEFQTGYFDGETSAAERQDTINAFNNSEKPEILVMSEAGGKSIELVASNLLYLFNPVWTYSLKKQIIDRLHRRGQKRRVKAYEFITRGTLEENIYKRTEQKREEYEKTVIDPLGYTSWFEENQAKIIDSVIRDIVRKN
jgi:SNF2 family DNA or RNA helicase